MYTVKWSIHVRYHTVDRYISIRSTVSPACTGTLYYTAKQCTSTHSLHSVLKLLPTYYYTDQQDAKNKHHYQYHHHYY